MEKCRAKWVREKKEEYLKQDSFYPKNRESKIRKNEEYLIERKRKRRKRLEKGDRKILNFKSTLYNGSGSPLVTTVGGFNLNHLITVGSTDNSEGSHIECNPMVQISYCKCSNFTWSIPLYNTTPLQADLNFIRKFYMN